MFVSAIPVFACLLLDEMTFVKYVDHLRLSVCMFVCLCVCLFVCLSVCTLHLTVSQLSF